MDSSCHYGVTTPGYHSAMLCSHRIGTVIGWVRMPLSFLGGVKKKTFHVPLSISLNERASCG